MMKFRDKIVRDVMEPAGKSKISNVTGEVIAYNSMHNVADVFVSNIGGNEGYTLRDVPIQLSGSGLHSSSLGVGDRVYVHFNNNSIFQPKITGKADELYATHTRTKEKHMRKGSLLVSQELEDGVISPSSNSWIDEGNKNYYKYIDYKDNSASARVSQMISEKGNFNGKEIGLYNPISSSIVKVKDNGDIDIFSSTNVGIRVSPKNRTVEILGDVSTKSKNWSVLSNIVEIEAKEKMIISTKHLDIKAETITRNGVQDNV